MNIFTVNPVLTVGILGWFAAQVIKTVLYCIKTKSFNPERIYGAGGMPSSHSSMVVSVVIITERVHGFQSTEFALAIIIAGVVIYDAMSVRYNAGLHAKELNRLRRVIDEIDDELSQINGGDGDIDALDDMDDSKRKEFKEFLGHTPLEVLAGSLLGIIIGMAFPLA